jgi:hypothetical protein
VVALEEARHAVLCELRPDYQELIRTRCGQAANLFTGPVSF